MQVGQKYGLPLLSPVDDAGVFTQEAGPFAGLQVQGDGNDAVVKVCRWCKCTATCNLCRGTSTCFTQSLLLKCIRVQALASAGVLLLEEKYAHKYPYDWRTKKPTIFRATSQVG